MGRTPKAAADRHEQILEAALDVFAAKGFDGATNRDVADAAGVTPGLIYHYFKNKKDLLAAALEKYSPLIALRSITPQMLELSPHNLLRVLVTRLLEILETDRFAALVRIFLPEAIHGTMMAPMLFSAIREGTGLLEGYFAKKMEEGQLRRVDPALTTHLLLGSIMDLVLRRRVLEDQSVIPYTREQIVEAIVDMSLNGLLPR